MSMLFIVIYRCFCFLLSVATLRVSESCEYRLRFGTREIKCNLLFSSFRFNQLGIYEQHDGKEVQEVVRAIQPLPRRSR